MRQNMKIMPGYTVVNVVDAGAYKKKSTTVEHTPFVYCAEINMNPDQIQTLIATFPQLQALIDLQETTWFNPATTSLEQGLPYVGLTQADVEDAHARLSRFAPYLAKAFPETAASGGNH